MTDRVDNAAALAEVLEFLADPPAPGTPEDVRFGDRLRQVLSASLVDDAVDEDDPVPKPELMLDDDLRGKLAAAAEQRSNRPSDEPPEGNGPSPG
ncbi:hypothetical protein ASD38_12955 [Caulobacter sp. Root487D2Y]|uniref:hypothetical protein n=1 Tax=Caulobacter sp. Root487D2Y TaxID=1736547 RepID=UPI0006F317E0|nr:hypothetical protein [Caulobacter sp. Root487D2Y]KQY30187.1 hypothetical protein ASD38_12955 [Caulobacter sp. Root487D2Y]